MKQNSSRNNRGKTHGNSRKGNKAGATRNQDGLLSVAEYPPVARATMHIVHYRNAVRLDPFPQRYRTVLTTAIRGTTTGGPFSASNAKLNSVWFPFNVLGWPGSTPAAATAQPTGFVRLCNIYSYKLYRVISSRITFSLTTEADADNILVTITPTSSTSNPPSGAAALSTEFTKHKQITRGMPLKDCTVVNKISQAAFLGVRKQAIEDDLSGNFAGSYDGDPVNKLYWTINVDSMNNEAFSNSINYICKLEHDVEVWGDIQAATDPAFAVQYAQGEAAPAITAETPSDHAVVDSPWGRVAPSVFLDAYLKARETQKKNPQ